MAEAGADQWSGAMKVITKKQKWRKRNLVQKEGN
jgi:hypothetical protein